MRHACVLTHLAWLTSTPALCAAAQEDVVVVGATVHDATGGPAIEDARIAIEGGWITCVSGPSGCARAGATEIDARGRWITPGLIDTHGHLDFRNDVVANARDLTLRFALGVTTVRDAGSQLPEALDARDRYEDAFAPVPRIVVAAHPSAASSERLGVPRGAALVYHLASLGVDAIKLKDVLVGEEWLEEVRTAASLGLPIFGHTWYGPPPVDRTMEAADAGLVGVSHLFAFAPDAQPDGTDLSLFTDSNAPGFYDWRMGLWTTALPEKLDARIDEMVRRGLWLEPMLVADYYWKQPLLPPASLGFLRDRPPSVRELLGRSDGPVGPTFPDALVAESRFVRAFVDRGGVVVAGSDNIRPGLALRAEIRLLKEAGIGAGEALRAATANAALVVGRPDLGTIEAGQIADLVVYGADPLADEGSLDVRQVVKGGVWYESAELLAPFREEYRAMARALWWDRLRRGLRLLLFPAVLMAFGLMVRGRVRRAPGVGA
jgi:hypothetical protein